MLKKVTLKYCFRMGPLLKGLPFYISLLITIVKWATKYQNHYVVYNKHVSFSSDLLKVTASRKEKLFVIMFWLVWKKRLSLKHGKSLAVYFFKVTIFLQVKSFFFFFCICYTFFKFSWFFRAALLYLGSKKRYRFPIYSWPPHTHSRFQCTYFN